MPRDVANVQTGLWGSPDWKSLTALEQWLYLHLLSHPTLSYAGVAAWFPKRLAAAAPDMTVDAVRALAEGLQNRRFVFISDATDEILIRSFLRHDGLLKQPKLAVSMANAFAAIASLDIQRIVVHELQRLSVEHPEWKAFQSDRVRAIMKHDGADMDDLRVARGDDLALGLPLDLPLGLPETAGSGLALPTATATTTATSPKGECREDDALDEWKPTSKHYEYGKEIGVFVKDEAEKFKRHAIENDRDLKNPNLAFTNWLKKLAPTGHPSTLSPEERRDRLRNPWKYA